MILQKYLYGWDKLEPIVLSSVAVGHNILLLGPHGVGKTKISQIISKALGVDGFIKYSMDKENLLSMVGCPSPEALKNGRLEYAKHNRSIFNAKIIMLDEISRAPKENQNIVLEIIEEKTAFGEKLDYLYVIATANNETYRGTFQIDTALLDRFHFVAPVPSVSNWTDLSQTDFTHIVEANSENADLSEVDKELRSVVEKIRNAYGNLKNNEAVRKKVVEFCASFSSKLTKNLRNAKDGEEHLSKISFRQLGKQFLDNILAVASYYKVMGDKNYIVNGALNAINFGIVTKSGVPRTITDPIFDKTKDILTSGDDEEVNKFKTQLTEGTTAERIKFINDNLGEFDRLLKDSDKSSILVKLMEEIVKMENDDERAINWISIGKAARQNASDVVMGNYYFSILNILAVS